jgi:hypothetical protein
VDRANESGALAGEGNIADGDVADGMVYVSANVG